jgi:hypothetical protein
VPNIFWEHWLDPFDPSSLEKMNYVDKTNDDEELEALCGEGFVEQLEEIIGDEPVYDSKPMKLMMTPMGVIPIYEHSLSSKVFKFFVGHADFRLTKKVVETINETNGVETLDVFTPYRFKVGIGKAFSSKKVLKSIQDRVYERVGKKSLKGQAIELFNELGVKNDNKTN